MQTNGYAAAVLSLKKVYRAENLSPEQQKAVNDTLTAINDKMYAAANKGDAQAAQAIQDLRKASGR